MLAYSLGAPRNSLCSVVPDLSVVLRPFFPHLAWEPAQFLFDFSPLFAFVLMVAFCLGLARGEAINTSTFFQPSPVLCPSPANTYSLPP